MLEISKVQEKDIDNLKKYNIFLDKEYDTLDNCFILRDNGNVCGYGYYDIHGTTAQIKQLEIFGEDKDLNLNIYYEVYLDFLIRGLINSAERKGLEKLSVDVKKIHNPSILDKLHFKADTISENAVLNIDDFFNIKCVK